MNESKKVLQPMRFVDAYCDFSPIQKDFIMLVQHITSKQKEIKSSFTINLRPYFEAKEVKLESIRRHHFKELTDDLMKSKVTFKYHKGDTLFSVYNLFSKCSVDYTGNKEFVLSVTIIDDVLPLFYINKLEEGHFKENRLVKELFQKSYPDFDKYISYYPRTFIEFKESQTKKLFEKLLAYRRFKKYTYEFSKDELYLMLGYGYLRDKNEGEMQEQIFQLVGQELVQTSYVGVNGWKNLRQKLNKWLKEISDNKDTGLTIIQNRKNYFSTRGRPIRSVIIQVVFDENTISLSPEQEKAFEWLKPYGLSDKQKFKIVTDFDFKTIVARMKHFIVAKSDNYNRRYYGDNRTPDDKKIENVPGFVYGIVFGYGKRKFKT
ncbi:hypothetical protein [Flagellimonas sp.]|uniref:hypothetical protein n=1 Tax=Flagellimonas sp. TaxID=2058762 RepID=UPI003BAD7B4F